MTAARVLADDCFLHDTDRIRHADCVAMIVSRLACVAAPETVSLGCAAGRILAESAVALRNVPLHDNAAVDGYAFAHAAQAHTGGRFRIGPRIVAGDTAVHALGAGQAARIFTGATIPQGADTVAMQEDCTAGNDGTVAIPPGLKQGANRRQAGEDLKAGEPVLEAGARLRPQDIAALASLGLAEVAVRRPLRVALLSTGSELREPGTAIAPGMVYDSNRAMLRALANTFAVTMTDIGILADDAAAIESAIRSAAGGHDLILATGGASRGEEDHVVTALERLGKRHLWQIAVKPGRPMTFGQIGDCVFMGLPGNPVAAFVCFLLYARPAITVLSGGAWREPQRFPVRAGFSVARKKPDRREFWRGWLEADAAGRPVARKFDRNGSGLISGLRKATGLIEVTEETTGVAEDDTVSFIPFGELGL